MYQNDNSGWNKKMTENVNIVKRIKGNQATKEEKKRFHVEIQERQMLPSI